MKRTLEEVANTIEGFVNGTGKQWDWDGFTSIRLDDPELEAMRKKIVALPMEFPSSNPRDYCGGGRNRGSPVMTAIFGPERRLFRATGHARGLWSGYAAGQRDHGADDARGRAAG